MGKKQLREWETLCTGQSPTCSPVSCAPAANPDFWHRPSRCNSNIKNRQLLASKSSTYNDTKQDLNSAELSFPLWSWSRLVFIGDALVGTRSTRLNGVVVQWANLSLGWWKRKDMLDFPWSWGSGAPVSVKLLSFLRTIWSSMILILSLVHVLILKTSSDGISALTPLPLPSWWPHTPIPRYFESTIQKVLLELLPVCDRLTEAPLNSYYLLSIPTSLLKKENK